MGNELATFDEWNEDKSLQWNLKTYPIHDSVSRLIRDLNMIYKYEEAMKVEEHNPAHFQWLMVDNSDQSIFAFERFEVLKTFTSKLIGINTQLYSSDTIFFFKNPTKSPE